MKIVNNGVEYQPIPLFKLRDGEGFFNVLAEIRINRYDVHPIYRSLMHVSKVGATRFILIGLGHTLLEIRQRGIHIEWSTFR